MNQLDQEIPLLVKREFGPVRNTQSKVAQWIGAISSIPQLEMEFETHQSYLNDLGECEGWKDRVTTTDHWRRPGLSRKVVYMPTYTHAYRFAGRPVKIVRLSDEYDADKKLILFRVMVNPFIKASSIGRPKAAMDFCRDGSVTCSVDGYANQSTADLNLAFLGFSPGAELGWQQAYDLLCAMAQKIIDSIPVPPVQKKKKWYQMF